MIVVIRNTALKRLVTDRKRRPVNFNSISKANLWLERLGNPANLIPIRVEAVVFTPEEEKQLLKINFQKKVV